MAVTMKEHMIRESALHLLSVDIPGLSESLGIKLNNEQEMAEHYAEKYPKWFDHIVSRVESRMEQIESIDDVEDENLFTALVLLRCYAAECLLVEYAQHLIKAKQ